MYLHGFPKASLKKKSTSQQQLSVTFDFLEPQRPLFLKVNTLQNKAISSNKNKARGPIRVPGLENRGHFSPDTSMFDASRLGFLSVRSEGWRDAGAPGGKLPAAHAE